MTYDDLHLITQWSQVVQLRDNGLLTPAELILLDAAETGETAQISRTVPNLKAPAVLIRAALLRYLILGGCKDFRTQPSGITVNGAWIGGSLDLNFTTARGPIDLYNCYLAEKPQMVQLSADGVAIVGCTLMDGLNAARLQISGNVTLNGSRVDGKISLSGGEIKGHLSCTQATLRHEGHSSLKAQGLTVVSSVLLEGTTATGQVSFLGSRIGGQLVCIGSSFHNPEGHALNAQSIQVRGDAFLRHATTEGEVSFLGAEVGGVLDCTHATMRNPEGQALNAQRLIVREGFIWRRIKGVAGGVDLTSAHVGDLWDDPESWAHCDKLYLSGFIYDVLHGSINVPDRLAWLKKGAISRREFYPQPYEQLAKLLRETGHRSDARAIMVAKEKEQRKASRARWRREAEWRTSLFQASLEALDARAEALASLEARRPNDENLARLQLLDRAKVAPDLAPTTLALALKQFRDEQRWFQTRVWWRNAGSLLADKVFGLVVGYGHKPERSFYMLLVLVAIGWFLADRAWEAGDFAPTMGPVLMSEGWQALATDERIQNPAQVWSDKYMLAPEGVPVLTPGRDYETFHALSYAVDLVVPIVALGQEASWAPSTTRGPWGQTLWWVRWWLIALGWIVTAIGAAAVTGVIRRD
ncbi:hypothetical protein SLH49_19140 [Cognatiyoonia sp. IB215446]|uniref:hypothetical protein n=1 Tax=Cognatiyoonia sp. IB215446 TaxID=3097355 RepID=UPI002A11B5AE|nr:hypothetical protein [Cognatiyoonia sp. IB215446]MDX8350112.1 hypothetical protein [Cognatiyoonia sp. IB215446]